MTYIIAEPCIDIKDLSCVDVCPVDCIHEFERILIIDPEECIDCGACEPECPVEAIFPEDALPEKWEPFVKINYAYGDGADVVNKLTTTTRPSTTSRTHPWNRNSLVRASLLGKRTKGVCHASASLEQEARTAVRAHQGSAKEAGASTKRAKEIAARTVNKERARSRRGPDELPLVDAGHVVGPPGRAALASPAPRARRRSSSTTRRSA